MSIIKKEPKGKRPISLHLSADMSSFARGIEQVTEAINVTSFTIAGETMGKLVPKVPFQLIQKPLPKIAVRCHCDKCNKSAYEARSYNDPNLDAVVINVKCHGDEERHTLTRAERTEIEDNKFGLHVVHCFKQAAPVIPQEPKPDRAYRFDE